jgi:hypothetical protein
MCNLGKRGNLKKIWTSSNAWSISVPGISVCKKNTNLWVEGGGRLERGWVEYRELTVHVAPKFKLIFSLPQPRIHLRCWRLCGEMFVRLRVHFCGRGATATKLRLIPVLYQYDCETPPPPPTRSSIVDSSTALDFLQGAFLLLFNWHALNVICVG